MGNHRISTISTKGFFPTNQPNSTQKTQPSTGKAPDIHSSVEPIFPTLQVPFAPPTSMMLVDRWVGTKMWLGWLGKNGKAKVGLYFKKKCHVCIYYICRRKKNYHLLIFF